MSDEYDFDIKPEPEEFLKLDTSPRPGSVPVPGTEPEPDLAVTGRPMPAPGAPARLSSLDAYRGFVMLAMASSGLGLAKVAEKFPENRVWKTLATQTEHVAWGGCTFWDLIQPSFMFMVGVAMPLAYVNRKAKGQGWWGQLAHAIGRSLVLILLGVFLSSQSTRQTNWTFVNVLTQIGLGYTFVFLVLRWGRPWQWAAAVAILGGYWAYFAFSPLPGTEGAWPVSPSMSTIADHWNKNANAASELDVRLLNSLPYPDGKGFKENDGGYTTLSFIPSIATAIFGVLVGRLLMGDKTPRRKVVTLLVAGVAGIAIGTALDFTVCPVVKRIWTPSWVLVSTGWTCLLMALFYLAVDVGRARWLAMPLIVVGANSIVMYVMADLDPMKDWVRQSLRTHLTTLTYVLDQWAGLPASLVPRIEREGPLFGGTYGPIYDEAAILTVLWLICVWLYRRKLFVRI